MMSCRANGTKPPLGKGGLRKTLRYTFVANNTTSSVIILQKPLMGGFVSVKRVYDKWARQSG